MYSETEWKEIEENPGFDEAKWRVGYLNMEEAMTHSEEKIQFILERTGCKDFELHFTRGRKSFPYTMVDANYKVIEKMVKALMVCLALKMLCVRNTQIRYFSIGIMRQTIL